MDCLYCKKEIVEPEKKQKYCNKFCFYKSRIKPRQSQTCIQCDQKFTPPKTRKNIKFCTQKCYGLFRKIHYRGPMHNSWKGGIVYWQGYRYLYRPQHPNCTWHGYVAEHRLVIEKSIGRFLDPQQEVVHHRDGDKRNNCLNNLELLNRAQHLLLHHFPDKYERMGH